MFNQKISKSLFKVLSLKLYQQQRIGVYAFLYKLRFFPSFQMCFYSNAITNGGGGNISKLGIIYLCDHMWEVSELHEK